MLLVGQREMMAKLGEECTLCTSGYTVGMFVLSSSADWAYKRKQCQNAYCLRKNQEKKVCSEEKIREKTSVQ